MKLSELQHNPKRLGETMLLYGPPKGGKTKLAGTLSKRFNLYWFDLENGIKTLVNDASLTMQDKERIRVFTIPDTVKNPVAIDTMLKVFTGTGVKICEEHGKVNCLTCMRTQKEMQEIDTSKLTKDDILVLDSITQLSDSAYNQVVGGELDADKEWKHYDAWNQRVAMCLSMVQQAPFHVLVLGHAQITEHTDGMERITPVGGTKKFSSNLAKYFGHVLYAEPKAGKFLVGSKQDYAANIVIGNRSDLKYGEGGITLADFFLPPSEVKKNPTTQAVLGQAATGQIKLGGK